MPNKWLLSIDSHDVAFSVIGINSAFTIKETIKDSIDTSKLQPGDKLLVYRNYPTAKIQYHFTVVDNSNEIKLIKTYELPGISADRIVELVPSLQAVLNTPIFEFYMLTDEQYELLWREFTSIQQDYTVSSISPELLNSPIDGPSIDLPHNRIIFGAPGTGKSFMLEEQREKYFVDRYRRVTFYPNYSYGQFFGTYKPIKERAIPTAVDSKITYDFVPGPFFKTLLDSIDSMQNGNAESHLLIVEEINRANAPAVFGDVFQLLDRDDHGVSEYPITLSEDAVNYVLEKHPTIQISNNEIKIPSNMYIWATMNSADQGVQPLDSAFKRRFDFEYININEGENKIQGIEVRIPGVSKKVEWNLFRRALNEFLVREYTHLKEDKLIGPFFIKKNVLENEAEFESAFSNKLLMYLFDDVLKTANKEKLFTKRTFSEVVDVSKNPDVSNRKVFTDLFYAGLLEKSANANAKQTTDESAQNNLDENNVNQTTNEDFEG